jgi:hypothetical protein
MLKKCGIVVTSVYDNNWLERIYKELQESGELENVIIYFIFDYKTPGALWEKISHLKTKGLQIIAPTLEEQNSIEVRHGISHVILKNSDHRRNLGYLLAWFDAVDFVISMDDDNFPKTPNFINEHRVRLGEQYGLSLITSDTAAYNNCHLLRDETHVYPRGYPFNKRKDNKVSTSLSGKINVGVNAGMWAISPDVDAISWLVKPELFEAIETVSDVALAPETYCPVNSQNTALLHKYIPAYYFVRMGYDIGGGMTFDRLGDIYSGYFLQKVCKHLGDYVSFGMPLVTHERNSHNYLKDANNEWGCLRTIDQFFDWLVATRLSGRTVSEAYLSLADALSEFAFSTHFEHAKRATEGFYHSMSAEMRLWARALS